MSDTTKRLLKIFGVGIIWVFILSVRIQGHTLFYYANDFLVQNQIVAAIDQTLGDGVDALFIKLGSAYDSVTGSDSKM
jgi:hypothetical protein